VETRLLELVREQRQKLNDLISNVFDQSLEGLNEIKKKVEDLQKRHAWYHSNVYQLHQLKSDLISIQQKYDERIGQILIELQRQKEGAKEIISNALQLLEAIIGTKRTKNYLNELTKDVDNLIRGIQRITTLGTIIAVHGLFGIIALAISMQTVGWQCGIATLGIGAVVAGTISEVTFKAKISDLISNLTKEIGIVECFEKKLFYNNKNNLIEKIVWYDKQIKNRINQYHVKKLTEEFLPETYTVLQMDTKIDLIELIISDVENNFILITSGSNGEEIISEIGSFWNINGIIIFCGRVEHHQSWACKYKKVLLVTDQFDKVIQQIKAIQCGEIYFLKFGFTLDDIKLKLKDVNYYLYNGFMTTDFSTINSNIDYHKNIMHQLHDLLISKNIYPNGIPTHFTIENLLKCAEMFVEALKGINPEKNIIYLYSLQKPYYYKIINDILNLLDEELLSLVGDYIKALRYALLKYSDTSNKLSSITNVKLYR
ncbi:unnamed protein product, partial [Rotaria sp. Silwood1]